MREASVIYPHQLFKSHPALAPDRAVFLVEEPLMVTEFPIHTQKLLLQRLSMQAYKKMLEHEGYQVTYISALEVANTAAVFFHIANTGYTHLHIVDTTDDWLEQRIAQAVTEHGFTTTRYESPLFILSKEDAVQRYVKSKKYMAKFYQQLRIDKKILLELNGSPTGGQWSFDADNRKKVPKTQALPNDIASDVVDANNIEVVEALQWLETLTVERYGDATVWIPWTHEAAQQALQNFLTERFSLFGDYEDAIVEGHTRIFHSTLSPLINCGLLTPQEVLDAVITYGNEHRIPLNTIEGFVRQVLGWREFMRASYECDGRSMRTKNFWQHERPIPKSFWNATTNIPPLDDAIRSALTYGYSHHIERLMVLGNFMLLTQIDPNAVYRWFMAMYVDAYDWVMVTNVYGMSQFADGGSFATKPYISGSAYIKKMSNYKAGPWEELWTALYWNFIATHAAYFASNHRLAMMPRLLENMDAPKREKYHMLALQYFSKQ